MITVIIILLTVSFLCAVIALRLDSYIDKRAVKRKHKSIRSRCNLPN